MGFAFSHNSCLITDNSHAAILLFLLALPDRTFERFYFFLGEKKSQCIFEVSDQKVSKKNCGKGVLFCVKTGVSALSEDNGHDLIFRHLVTRIKSHYKEMTFRGICTCTIISSLFLRHTGPPCNKWIMACHVVVQIYQKSFNSTCKADLRKPL